MPKNIGVVAACVAMGFGLVVGDCVGQDTTSHRPRAIVSDGRGSWGPDNGWRLVEELRLGALDGPAPEVFGQIVAVAVDDDGRLYVADGQAQDVRVFESTGEYSHTVGGRGEGPGEFTRIRGLAIDRDGRLLVWDVGNLRYTLFDPSGRVVETYRRTVRGSIIPWPGRILDDGRLMDWGVRRHRLPSGEVGPRTNLTPVRVSLDGASTAFPPIEVRAPTAGDGRPKIGSPGLVVAQEVDGNIWFAATHEYTLYERTLSGDTLRVVSLPSHPVPVARDSIIDSALESGRLVDRADIYPFHRLVTRIVVDADHVYVLPHEPSVREGAAMDVFAAAGEYLGRMQLPDVVETTEPPPLVVSGRVYAVVYDSLDVPYVVRWRIVEN